MRLNPFKRGGGKAAASGKATSGGAPSGGQASAPKSGGGWFSRTVGKVGKALGRGKPEPEPEEETGPAAPAGPEGRGDDEGGAGGGAGGRKPRRSSYPRSLGVAADGIWQISSTEWEGVMAGVLHGEDVEEFLDAMDNGDHDTAIKLIAEAYDGTVGGLITPEDSVAHRITY